MIRVNALFSALSSSVRHWNIKFSISSLCYAISSIILLLHHKIEVSRSTRSMFLCRALRSGNFCATSSPEFPSWIYHASFFSFSTQWCENQISDAEAILDEVINICCCLPKKKLSQIHAQNWLLKWFISPFSPSLGAQFFPSHSAKR